MSQCVFKLKHCNDLQKRSPHKMRKCHSVQYIPFTQITLKNTYLFSLTENYSKLSSQKAYVDTAISPT